MLPLSISKHLTKWSRPSAIRWVQLPSLFPVPTGGPFDADFCVSMFITSLTSQGWTNEVLWLFFPWKIINRSSTPVDRPCKTLSFSPAWFICWLVKVPITPGLWPLCSHHTVSLLTRNNQWHTWYISLAFSTASLWFHHTKPVFSTPLPSQDSLPP